MICGFERFARASRGAGPGDEFLVHLQVGLKLEGFAHIPMLMARERGEEFLTKGGGFFAGHGLGLFGFGRRGRVRDEFKGAGGDGEECFALKQVEKIAVQASVDLQRVAAVLDDVGIDKARDAAFAEEGFAQARSERRGDIRGF